MKDNGIGIGPEFHEKIFELFQTLRRRNEKESTCIGLAIVKKIIEEQGGSTYSAILIFLLSPPQLIHKIDSRLKTLVFQAIL